MNRAISSFTWACGFSPTLKYRMTSSKPAASTFFKVSAIRDESASRTEFPSGHLDEISITWRRRFWVAGQCRDGALSVIAYLANSLRFLLRLGVGKVREIAAHQAPRRMAVSDASLMIDIGHLLQPTEAYCRGKWRDDQAASEPRGKLDRRFRERSDLRRDWLLHWCAADLKALTDARIGIVKAALQLTPEQAKYWPAVEEANPQQGDGASGC